MKEHEFRWVKMPGCDWCPGALTIMTDQAGRSERFWRIIGDDTIYLEKEFEKIGKPILTPQNK